MSTLLLTVLGCNLVPERGDAPVVPPEQRHLSAPDQVLPGGIVGRPYGARVTVEGGDPPYSWFLLDARLPSGLTLQQDGRIDGTPTEAGRFSFSLVAKDASGRSKRTVVSMLVALDPIVARCGDRLTGSFDRSIVSANGPDLNDLKNLAWIAIERPEDLTQRIELAFDNTAIGTLYVERPGETLGSWALDEDYVPKYLNPGVSNETVTLDAGTDPSFTGYLTQELVPLLLVAQSSGDWQMDVVCTDGPVFQQVPQYPTELGQPIQIDYDVYGDNTNVRIWTDDPLPSWIVWDEATGVVSGTAMETGSWEFTVVAETEDGRRREERSILGVYDVLEAPCESVTPLTVSEGYFDGEFIGYWDTRGYDVLRVPLDDPSVSAVDLRVTGSDGHYLGLSDPDPEWLKFYGGAQRVYIDDQDARIDLGTTTYPGSRHYAEAGELYLSAGSTGSDLQGLEVHVTCDHSPRVDMAALPVIQPLQATDAPLRAIGGTPPYTWTGRDLPAGLSVRADGALVGSTGAQGKSTVQLTVEDSTGASSSESYTLYVGTEAACRRATPITCGDSIDGRFTKSYGSDGNGRDSTEVFCLVDDREHTYGLELYSEEGELRVDVGDPGVEVEDLFVGGNATYTTFVPKDGIEALPLDPYSWPDLDDYDGQRLLIGLRAYTPGAWTAHLVCSPKG